MLTDVTGCPSNGSRIQPCESIKIWTIFHKFLERFSEFLQHTCVCECKCGRHCHNIRVIMIYSKIPK